MNDTPTTIERALESITLLSASLTCDFAVASSGAAVADAGLWLGHRGSTL